MQNTTPNLWISLFGLAILALFLSSFLGWVAVGMARFHGTLKVPKAEERKLAPWGLIDIVVAAFAFIFMQILFAGIAIGLGYESLEKYQKQQESKVAVAFESPKHIDLISDSLAMVNQDGASETSSPISNVPVDSEPTSEAVADNGKPGEEISETKGSPPAGRVLDLRYAAWLQTSALIAMMLATAWIALRCQVSIGRVGWSVRRIGWDWFLAGVVIVLFVPSVYVLMAAASMGLKQDYNHPIFEMVGKNLWLIGFAVWMAVVVAPLTEEFFFRVLLQGYLESMAAGKVTIKEVIFGRANPPQWIAGGLSLADGPKDSPMEIIRTTRTDESSFDAASISDAGIPLLNPVILNDPYATPPLSATSSQLESTSTLGNRYGRLAWWPTFVTGTLFGLAHFEYGVSWIPLTFLGIILGLLFRMTNRIWPSLLVHVFVNSVAMMGLAAKIISGVE